MTFRHTNRPGFLLGLIDFCTAGLFFLIYMPFGGLQDEIETVLGHPVMPYWKAGSRDRTRPGGICSAGIRQGFCCSARPLQHIAFSRH